jgi:hypothetical protein
MEKGKAEDPWRAHRCMFQLGFDENKKGREALIKLVSGTCVGPG